MSWGKIFAIVLTLFFFVMLAVGKFYPFRSSPYCVLWENMLRSKCSAGRRYQLYRIDRHRSDCDSDIERLCRSSVVRLVPTDRRVESLAFARDFLW